MSEVFPVYGIYGIPGTPFDQAGEVDYESYRLGVEDRINAGVEGLLVAVVASEADRLTEAERRATIALALQTTDSRVPVIVGASYDDAETCRSMAAFAVERGAIGVCVQAPTRLIRDPDGLIRFFRTVCETELPMLMIQDLEWNGPGLSLETIKRLADELPAFRCIKVETVPAGPKYTAILDDPDLPLNVSGGWAVTQLIEGLDRGVHAYMAGGFHWILVEIVRRYRAGDRVGAQDLFDRMIPASTWKGQHIDIANRFNKELAVRQGIYADARLRDPRVRWDDFHQRIANDLIDQIVALDLEVGWRPPV